MMEVEINGQRQQIGAALTIAQLLAQLDKLAPHVAVEVNAELVPRAQHADHCLKTGDRIEIVTLVGGG